MSLRLQKEKALNSIFMYWQNQVECAYMIYALPYNHAMICYASPYFMLWLCIILLFFNASFTSHFAFQYLVLLWRHYASYIYVILTLSMIHNAILYDYGMTVILFMLPLHNVSLFYYKHLSYNSHFYIFFINLFLVV